MGEGTVITAATRAFRHGEAHVAQLQRIVAEGDVAAAHLLPTYGNRFELLEGADAFIPRLVDDILGAEHHVNLTFYGWHPPGTPGSWVDQVSSAAMQRAGEIPVTAIVDQVGTGLLIPGAKRMQRRMFIEQLRASGMEVLDKPLTFGRGGVDDARLAVDHRKIAEIDGWVNYQGGMNLVDQWLTWHDVMVRTEGPMSAQAGAVLAGRWRELGGTVTDARMAVLADAMRRPVDDASHATELLTNGSRHRRELTDAFIAEARAVAEATEPSRLWLANPYLADPRAMEPVVAAARAGHDVRLILAPKVTGGGQMQDVFTDPLRRAWAWEIANAGGTVTVVPDFSHAKVWLSQVGQRPTRATAGAFNLDIGSTRRNYENAVRTTDPQLVEPVEAMFAGQEGRGLLATSDVIDGWKSTARWRRAFNLQY
jgi:cardiolipin synthase